MGGAAIHQGNKNGVREHLAGSALAALINYPLWRASAIGQSGFVVHATNGVPRLLAPYLHAFLPPYKGAVSTVLGMTWARAAIFWVSDAGRNRLRLWGYSEAVATVLPPLLVSTIVQCINMPIVRSTITIQDPQSPFRNVPAAMRHIYKTHGAAGLWHGTSAGILKTVPKYCTAIVVKDVMEEWLTPVVDCNSPTYESDRLVRSAKKSVAAGIAGAALTNPLDVIRNEMFKTNYSLSQTVRYLWKDVGYSFLTRGLGKNMVAVAIPLACTIFFTDAFLQRTARSRSSSLVSGGRTKTVRKEQTKDPSIEQRQQSGLSRNVN
jgi:hypothetical protein